MVSQPTAPVEDNIYVVKRTYVDLKDPAEPAFHVALPATFSDLSSAKTFAKQVLRSEGYDTEFFRVYDVNDGTSAWKHDNGIIVFGEGPNGEEFQVAIDTVYNATQLDSEVKGGRVPKPLWHVLQTKIDYDNDRSGAKRESVVEATYASKEAAMSTAYRVLIDGDVSKKSFVEYDEYKGPGEGPFGAEVLVHAVEEGGQNLLVSVVVEK